MATSVYYDSIYIWRIIFKEKYQVWITTATLKSDSTLEQLCYGSAVLESQLKSYLFNDSFNHCLSFIWYLYSPRGV